MTNAREMLMSNTGYPMDVQIRVTDGCPKSDILWTSILCPFYDRTSMDINGRPQDIQFWTSFSDPFLDVHRMSSICPFYVRTLNGHKMDIHRISNFGHPSVTRIWTSMGCPVYVHGRADVNWTENGRPQDVLCYLGRRASQPQSPQNTESGHLIDIFSLVHVFKPLKMAERIKMQRERTYIQRTVNVKHRKTRLISYFIYYKYKI